MSFPAGPPPRDVPLGCRSSMVGGLYMCRDRLYRKPFMSFLPKAAAKKNIDDNDNE